MMYELDDQQDARRYADTAMQLIESYSIHSTPDFFRLLYDYASERDPVVVKRLRDVSDETPAVFRKAAADLVQTHYAERPDVRVVAETGDAMQEQIREVVDQVHSAGDDVHDFGDALDGLADNLGALENGAAMTQLISQMVMVTRRMKVKSDKLEQDLKQSANEIRNLQERLEESRREALTDVLTGVTNRAGFDRALIRHGEWAVEDGTPLSLVMCDIDHFKRFNDTYGHQLGDQVLKLVGGVLHGGLKGRDVPCRYGGEEFALILPETDIHGAAKVADNIRKTIGAKRIVRKSTGEEISRVTMSFGVAEFCEGEAPGALVGRADAALYRAKSEGRNRVCTADPPVLTVAAE